jgi:hypothetical protein
MFGPHQASSDYEEGDYVIPISGGGGGAEVDPPLGRAKGVCIFAVRNYRLLHSSLRVDMYSK